MSPLKTVLGNSAVRRVLCWLGAQYIRLVRWTGSWSVVRGNIPEGLWNEGRPFVACFWHGRLLMMSYCWRRDIPVTILISQHRDGRLIGDTVSHFGAKSVAGSTTRGGGAALRGLLRILKAGECVGIIPDGPHGPRMRASGGVVSVARLAGVPIVPLTYSSRRRRLLPTWDRFLLPLPFGRRVAVWGEPIEVPRDADAETVEAVRRRVEDSLNAITEEADRLCGHGPVEPAPLTEGAPS